MLALMLSQLILTKMDFIKLSGYVAETHFLDVTDKSAIASMVIKVKEPDILFNCAGIVHDGTIIDAKDDTVGFCI